MNYSNRIYGLDVFRTIAILLVVYVHGKLVAKDLFASLPSLPIMDGVELFFVLSGFLIGGILIKTIERENGMDFPALGHFWKRRWFRTLPNYYLILIVNYLLVRYDFIGGNIENFSFKFLLFLQNFSSGFTDFFWESWSLAIEEWFYILLPLLLWLLLKVFGQKRALLIAAGALILVPMAYRFHLAEMDVDAFWLDVNFRKVVLTRLDAILWGVIAAYIKFYHASFWSKAKNTMFITGILLIAIHLYLPKSPNDFYSKTFSFSVVSIAAAMLLAKADDYKQFKFPLIGKTVTFISQISYSMYLVNLALVAQVIVHNVTLDTTYEKGVFYVIYWVLTILISYVIYRFYEKPLMNLRDKI